jgi:hypothetical protein
MITLEMKQAHEFKVGETIHLRITDIRHQSPGRWKLLAEDVTPLPGAEPTGYACHICGIVEPAKEDGSLPDGWILKSYEEGTCFVCRDEYCQAELICRVCGCTKENRCETKDGPCHWVEYDLCSACAGRKVDER